MKDIVEIVKGLMMAPVAARSEYVKMAIALQEKGLKLEDIRPMLASRMVAREELSVLETITSEITGKLEIKILSIGGSRGSEFRQGLVRSVEAMFADDCGPLMLSENVDTNRDILKILLELEAGVRDNA